VPAAVVDGGPGAEAAAVDRATLCEADLGDPDAARAAWTAYLERHPAGRHAARALLARSRLAEAAGDAAAAAEDWRRLLAGHTESEEATHALVLLGRALLAAEDWEAAGALFAPWAESDGPRGEAALVGLVRVRLGEGRGDAARALAERYRERFPNGERRADVEALLERLGEGGP